MQKKFKLKLYELKNDDVFFDQLPLTAMSNVDEYLNFKNFVQSDMLIESLRAVKAKVMTDHLQHPGLRNKLRD